MSLLTVLTYVDTRATYTFPFSRYPAVRIVLLLIAGILTARFLSLTLFNGLVIFATVFSLYFLVEWRSKNVISYYWPGLAGTLFLVLIIGFGMIRTDIKIQSNQSPVYDWIEVSPWETVEVEGEIESISRTAAGKPRWKLSVLTFQMDTLALEVQESMNARILTDHNFEATIGDQVIFSGTIIPVSEKRNPADFDYRSYLQSQNIQIQIRLDSLITLKENDYKTSWTWWREQAINLADQNFDTETAPIAKALLLGYKQDLDAEAKTAFARSGLSHIMAVSGLHVGFIIAPFWIIIPYFWTMKYGRQLGLALLILLLVMYAGITGFSASVMRASVMAGFITYGKLFHKVNDSVNLTAAAAIVLLIIDPMQLFQIGFQLSFSAVLIILLILPVIQNLLPYWLRVHWSGKPLMVIIVSIVVQFGLYPLQVYYFGEVSLISPIANALFVPLLGFVVPVSLAALFMTAFVPVAGFILNYPSLLFLKGMAAFVNEVSGWSWAWFSAGLPGFLFFGFWLFLVFFIASTRIPTIRWKMLISALIIFCWTQMNTLITKFQPAKMEITFFDVGQGDAALIHTPSGKKVLIDAGIWSPGYNSGKSVIIPHLQKKGISHLDAVILSHPHSDHIGGIPDLINSVEIDTIYNSGFEYESKLYQNYLRLAREKGIPVKSLKAGSVLNIDPSMLFLILGPDGHIYNDDPNQHSVIVNIIYGENEFLFTGDAGENQEERLVHNYRELLDTDLLKVGHHGSRTSSGSAFLSQITPELAIVSLAERNRFNHPHSEAVHHLQRTNAELLFTSREKAVIIQSDGENIAKVDWY